MVRPRRSVLYMPGANERALEKATAIPADALILDLEDAVAPEAKEAARNQRVAAMVRARPYGKREIVIRVQRARDALGEDDIRGDRQVRSPMRSWCPRSAAAQVTTSAAIDTGGRADRHPVWAMMETPAAILNARRGDRAVRPSAARPVRAWAPTIS